MRKQLLFIKNNNNNKEAIKHFKTEYKNTKTWIYPQKNQWPPRYQSKSKCGHIVGSVVQAWMCGCTRSNPSATADGIEPPLPFTIVKCDRLDRFM